MSELTGALMSCSASSLPLIALTIDDGSSALVHECIRILAERGEGKPGSALTARAAIVARPDRDARQLETRGQLEACR